MFVQQVGRRSFVRNCYRSLSFRRKRDPLDRRDTLLESVRDCRPEEAMEIFRSQDPTSLNAAQYHQMMKHFPQPDQIRGFIREMKETGVTPDTKAYTMLIGSLCKSGNIDEAIEVKNGMLKDNIRVNFITYSTLLKYVIDHRSDMGQAEQLFEEMRNLKIQPPISIFSIMINGYAKRGDIQNITRLIDIMETRELESNSYTRRAVLQGIINSGNLMLAEQFLDEIVQKGNIENCILHNTLLKAYAGMNDLDRCFEMLREMKSQRATHPSVITYTIVVSAVARGNDWDRVNLLLLEMMQMGVYPNLQTYETLIRVAAESGNFMRARWLIEYMKIAGVEPSPKIFSFLISYGLKAKEEIIAYSFCREMISQCGRASIFPLVYQICQILCSNEDLKRAKELIDEYYRVQGDSKHITLLYNCIIRALSKKEYSEVGEAFDEMLARCTPDIYTFGPMLNLYAQSGKIDQVNSIVKEMEIRGVKLNVVCYSSVIQAYVKGKDIRGALKIQEQMIQEGIQPNEYTQTIIANGIISNRNPEDILELLEFYRQQNIPISTKLTSLILLRLHQNTCDPLLIKRFFAFCEENGVSVVPKQFFTMLNYLLCNNNNDIAQEIARFPNITPPLSNEILQRFLVQKAKTDDIQIDALRQLIVPNLSK